MTVNRETRRSEDWRPEFEETAQAVQDWGRWMVEAQGRGEVIWSNSPAACATLRDCARVLELVAGVIDGLEWEVEASDARRALCYARLHVEDVWYTVAGVAGERGPGESETPAPMSVLGAGFSNACAAFLSAAFVADTAVAGSPGLGDDLQRVTAIVGTVLGVVRGVVSRADAVVDPTRLSGELASLRDSADLLEQPVRALLETSVSSSAQLGKLMELPEVPGEVLVGELCECLAASSHKLSAAARGAWSRPGTVMRTGSAAMAGLLSAAVRATEVILDVGVESDEASWLRGMTAHAVRRTMSEVREAGSALSLGARTRAVGGGGHLSGAVTAIAGPAELVGFEAVYRLAQSMADGSGRSWGAAVASATAETGADVLRDIASFLQAAGEVAAIVAVAGDGQLDVAAQVTVASAAGNLTRAAEDLRKHFRVSLELVCAARDLRKQSRVLLRFGVAENQRKAARHWWQGR